MLEVDEVNGKTIIKTPVAQAYRLVSDPSDWFSTSWEIHIFSPSNWWLIHIILRTTLERRGDEKRIGLWENYPSKNFIVEFVSYQNIITDLLLN